MQKSILALALFVLLIVPASFADARGGGMGGRSGGFSGSRSISAPRVSAPSVRTGSIPSRTTGFQTARTVSAPRAPSTYAASHTTVNNYGGYGGGGGGFFSGYLMGSMIHPFGFGYGMYGGGYGYGVDAMGGAYYPSTGAMIASWLFSLIFLGLFLWLVIAIIVA